MAKAYHEALHPLGNLGIQVSMAALENNTHSGTLQRAWRSYSA